MKQLFQTAQGTHIIEATGSELATLLLAKQSLDAICDQFEFVYKVPESVTQAGPQKVTIPALAPRKESAENGDFTRDTRLCLICKTEFEVKRKDQKYCSKRCLDKSYRLAKAKAAVKAPVKKAPAKEVAGLSPRTCRGCGKKFSPHRKDQNCCTVACRRKLPRNSNKNAPAKTTTIKVMRNGRPATQEELESAVLGKQMPAAPVQKVNPKADRLAMIRAADRRLKEKGIAAPSVWSGSDSGIGAPTAEDIAAVTRGKEI